MVPFLDMNAQMSVPDDYISKEYYLTWDEAYGTNDGAGACTDQALSGSVWKDDACDGSIPPKCVRCMQPRYMIEPCKSSFQFSPAFG